MKIMTAHRILISSAVVFFLFFAGWEYRNYLQSQESWALVRSGFYLTISCVLAIYLKNLRRWYKS